MVALPRGAALLSLSSLLATALGCASLARAYISRIEHLVIIYQENHSFDNLYGEFAGAEGLASPAAMAAPKQIDPNGNPYALLPQPMDASHGAVPDSRFPANLANAP